MTEIISGEIISKPSESCMQLDEDVEQEDGNGNENKDEGAYS